MNFFENPSKEVIPVLFRDRNGIRYDLVKSRNTQVLVDTWFQLLLKKASTVMAKHL